MPTARKRPGPFRGGEARLPVPKQAGTYTVTRDGCPWLPGGPDPDEPANVVESTDGYCPTCGRIPVIANRDFDGKHEQAGRPPTAEDIEAARRKSAMNVVACLACAADRLNARDAWARIEARRAAWLATMDAKETS